MKRLLAFILCLLSLQAFPATITFTLTNSVGTPDTNAFTVTPISTPVYGDGNWVITGLAIRLVPNSSGFVQTNLAYGNYIASNRFLVGSTYSTLGTSRGILFAVPNSSGTFFFTSNAISGGNVFNYNGAQFVATSSNIFSAIGYTPLTPTETTNAIKDSTNGLAKILPGTNVVFTTNTGVVTISASAMSGSNSVSRGNNLVTITTNSGNYAVAGVSQTNSLYPIAQGTNVIFATNSGIITISASASGGGSNSVSRGNNLVVITTNSANYAVSGVSQTNSLYPIIQGTNVIFSTNAGSITISANPAGGGSNSVSRGNNLVVITTNSANYAVSGVSQTNSLYPILQGTNILFSTNAGTITISSTGTGSGGSNSVSAANNLLTIITNSANYAIAVLQQTNSFTSIVRSNSALFTSTNDPRTLYFSDSSSVYAGRTTNGVNLGSAFSSPGSASHSEQFGFGSTASGISGISLGFGAVASGLSAPMALGPGAQATDSDTFAIGEGAVASAFGAGSVGIESINSGTNSLVFGNFNTLSGTNSMLFANGVTSSGNNRITFGDASQFVLFPGNGTIAGVFTNGSLVTGLITVSNNQFAIGGTNVVVMAGGGNVLTKFGAYEWLAVQYTNRTTGYTITNNGVSWTIYNSSLSPLYASTAIVGASWTSVGGSAPVPTSSYGFYQAASPAVITGVLQSTNLDARISAITNGIPQGSFQPGNIILTNLTLTKPNTNSYIPGSNITLTTNSGGIVTIASTASGSGTGIATNGGSGFGNTFSNAILVASPTIELTNLTIDRDLFLQWTTNNLWVSNAGSASANGTYLLGSNAFYTNVLNTNWSIGFQGTVWNMLSNIVTYYVTTNSPATNNWSISSGASPAPKSGYGAHVIMTGQDIWGTLASTNLTYQITNTIANSPLRATNAIANTNGFGTNTTLYNVTIASGNVVLSTNLAANSFGYLDANTNFTVAPYTPGSNTLSGLTSAGLFNTNDYATAQVSFSDSSSAASVLLPPLVFFDFAWNQSETNESTAPNSVSLTNLVKKAKTLGIYDVWKQYGQPWIFFDYQWVGTNRTAAGEMTWNTNGVDLLGGNGFPSGSNNMTFCHTNGYRVILWAQSTTVLEPNGGGTIPITTVSNIMRDFPYMATNWGVDGFWYDSNSYGSSPNVYAQDIFASTMQNLGRPIYTQCSPYATGAAAFNQVVAHYMSVLTAVHFEYLGDPVSSLAGWNILTNYWNDIQNYGWYKYVKPGHYIDSQQMGYWGRSYAQEHSDAIMHSMLSAVFHYGNYLNGTLSQVLLTNQQFMDINQDPAVIAASRVLSTNGCDVYLKPLKSATGPTFAISVFNPSNLTASFTLPFSSLPLRTNTYNVTDVEAMTTASASSLTVSLTNYDSKVWVISPPSDFQSTIAGQVLTNNFTPVNWRIGDYYESNGIFAINIAPVAGYELVLKGTGGGNSDLGMISIGNKNLIFNSSDTAGTIQDDGDLIFTAGTGNSNVVAMGSFRVSGTASFTNGLNVVTGGITNASLTASTYLLADVNKKVVSATGGQIPITNAYSVTSWKIGDLSETNGLFALNGNTVAGFESLVYGTGGGNPDFALISPASHAMRFNESDTLSTITGDDNLSLVVTSGSGTMNVIAPAINFQSLLTLTNGISTLRSNKLAPQSITFPATTVPWTNNIGYNIEVYIDNAAVTGTAISKNGTTIFSGLSADITIGLQPGEYFAETYTVGTPSAKWSPR